MPVVDWTRTDLMCRLPTTGYALRFDAVDFAAYDAVRPEPPGAEADLQPDADRRGGGAAEGDERGAIGRIERNAHRRPAGDVAARSTTAARFARRLALYDGIGPADLRANHARSCARSCRWPRRRARTGGPSRTIRPSRCSACPGWSPPPRTCAPSSTRSTSPANGLTFCTGSLRRPRRQRRARAGREFAPHIHFAHLRNVTVEPDGSFYEAEHLDGRPTWSSVIVTLMAEEAPAAEAARTRSRCGRITAICSPTTSASADQSGLFADRPPQGPGRAARDHACGGAVRTGVTLPKGARPPGIPPAALARMISSSEAMCSRLG